MRKEVTYCDKCGKQDAHHFSYVVDRKMDAAGSMDNEHDNVDLCAACCIAQLELLILRMSWEERAVLTKTIKHDRKLYLWQATNAQKSVGGF